MKIIKPGKIKSDEPKKHTCKSCGCKFEYDKTDVKYDFREGNYVVCPTCNTFINVE